MLKRFLILQTYGLIKSPKNQKFKPQNSRAFLRKNPAKPSYRSIYVKRFDLQYHIFLILSSIFVIFIKLETHCHAFPSFCFPLPRRCPLSRGKRASTLMGDTPWRLKRLQRVPQTPLPQPHHKLAIAALVDYYNHKNFNLTSPNLSKMAPMILGNVFLTSSWLFRYSKTFSL